MVISLSHYGEVGRQVTKPEKSGLPSIHVTIFHFAEVVYQIALHCAIIKY